MKAIKSGIINYASYKAACDAHNIPYMTFYLRVNKLGWSVSKALRKPVREKRLAAREEEPMNMTQQIMWGM